MHALILAAGRGERMRPLTDRLPKVLAPVAGKPLIVWQIEALARAGFLDLVVNTAWLGKEIEAALGDGAAFGVRLTYSREGTALETRGGIVAALPHLGSRPFVVVSGDIHTDYDYGRLVDVIGRIENEGTAAAHLVLVDNPSFHAHGDMGLDQDGRIVPDAAARLTYGNIGVFSPTLFRDLPARERAKLFPWLYRFAAEGRLTGEHFQGEWFNVGTLAELAGAEAAHQRRSR